MLKALFLTWKNCLDIGRRQKNWKKECLGREIWFFKFWEKN